MKSIEVKNKEELKKAKEEGYDEIIVVGDLAKKVKKAKGITKLSAASIGILTTALAAATVTAPLTGGLSYAVAVPIATVTGTQIAVIMAVAVCGLALILALFKDYEEIEFSMNPAKLKLHKKKKVVAD